MRIAVIQLSYGDEESFGARLERVSSLVADQAGHDLVVLPELWGATGFDYRRWDVEAQPIDGPWTQAMAAAARSAGVTLHAGSLVERMPEPGPDGNDLANTSVVFDAQGGVVATYRKVHRFGFGTGEPKLMEAGTEVVVTSLPAGGGEQVPVGISTCYDLRFPELYRRLVDSGAIALAIPAAFTLTTGKDHWHVLLRARAIEQQCYVLAAAQTGHHYGKRWSYGHALIADPWGTVLAECGEGEGVAVAEVDPAYVAKVRAALPSLAHRRMG